MPYINKEDRRRIEEAMQDDCNLIEELASRITCAGDFNYVVTRLLHECINNWGMNYDTLNELVGAMECCKLEFVRRVVSPYEDKKIEENGDVHPKNL